MSRLQDMTADAVCRDAAGLGALAKSSPDDVIATFNGHIAPIAKLYGFDLQMELIGDKLALRGDISKAHSVLLYLCQESRTPEIDWLLDCVALCRLSEPLGKTPSFWKSAWNKLRHTKRGKWWRGLRGILREGEIARDQQRRDLIAKHTKFNEMVSDARRSDPALNDYPVDWPHRITASDGEIGQLVPKANGGRRRPPLIFDPNDRTD
jgi:hypothetical protein